MNFKHVILKACAFLDAGDVHRCVELLRSTIMNSRRKDDSRLNLDSAFFALYHTMSKCSPMEDDCLTMFARCVSVTELILEPHKAHVPRCLPYNFRCFQDVLVKHIGHLVRLLSSMSERDIDHFHQSLGRFVNLNLRDDLGCQLLHLACHTSEVVEVLLKAGANPQAVDGLGYTPLHCVAMKPDSSASRRRVIKLLMSKCCCCGLNIRDVQKKLFTDYLPSEILCHIKMPLNDMSLQCLSAKAVVNYSIAYQSVLPTCLSEYVKMHLWCMR